MFNRRLLQSCCKNIVECSIFPQLWPFSWCTTQEDPFTPSAKISFIICLYLRGHLHLLWLMEIVLACRHKQLSACTKEERLFSSYWNVNLPTCSAFAYLCMSTEEGEGAVVVLKWMTIIPTSQTPPPPSWGMPTLRFYSEVILLIKADFSDFHQEQCLQDIFCSTTHKDPKLSDLFPIF